MDGIPPGFPACIGCPPGRPASRVLSRSPAFVRPLPLSGFAAGVGRSDRRREEARDDRTDAPTGQHVSGVAGWDRIAVLGAGTIGASWAALFLATGRAVTVHDPGLDEATVRSAIESTAATLRALGLPAENLTARLRFAAELEEAVSDADVVQENGPENPEFKRELWPRVEQAVKPTTLLLSSASGLTASQMGVDMKDPGRVVVGHPFNPPHLIPLVEVVPSPSTPAALVDEVVAFYRAVGKRPFVIRREIRAFVANRLQMALFRECIHLVSSGVVSMADLDEVVTSSIGLRWAVAGPFQTFHLGGGPGGLAEFLDKFGPRMKRAVVRARVTSARPGDHPGPQRRAGPELRADSDGRAGEPS